MEPFDMVAVWTALDGRPKRFECRGRVFIVCGTPVPWVERAPWWSVAIQADEVHCIEQQLWRVDGLDTTTGEVTRVDLAVEEPGWWRLATVHS
jgi:hypothetical protein